MRLIDANALVDALFDQRRDYPQWIVDIIGEMPDAVVHCKDCKYAVLTYNGECKYCKKRIDDNGGMEKLYLPGDWFCADGERGENNGSKV